MSAETACPCGMDAPNPACPYLADGRCIHHPEERISSPVADIREWMRRAEERYCDPEVRAREIATPMDCLRVQMLKPKDFTRRARLRMWLDPLICWFDRQVKTLAEWDDIDIDIQRGKAGPWL